MINEVRRKEILEEIVSAKPKLIVLLGDRSIKWFLFQFVRKYNRLEQFGYTEELYGRIHRFTIEDKEYNVLPLVHPRQAAGIGYHSKKLRELHKYWLENVAPTIKKSVSG